MKRSDYLLKENIGKKKEEKKPQKRSEKLLKNPVGMTSGAITSSTATEKPKTTAAPKVTTSKKDKSYTGVDAEINRREASRSARYSMQPEVRAAEIKRAEARGDTKRASELKKAKDIKRWAKEQVNSDFVKTRAQTVYDNEFNAAKLRGDQSPAVAAEHAAQGYLDMFRNKPQETKDETYAYRQAVRKNEYEGIDSRADYNERVIQGRAIIPQGKRDAGQSIIAYLNSPELRRQREERGEQFGDGSTILEHISVMTDAEKNRFRYLAATGDWEKVNDYYDLIKRDLNKRAQEETNKETYAESYNSPVKGTVKNVVAGFMTPGAYIATGANAIANKFRDDYIPVDTNSPMFAGAHMARETSSGVTERASDAVGGGTAGEIASLIAGTGLSMANFISKAPLGGVGSMVAMGLDSAGQTTLDVLERGGTEGQALLLGTAAGAIEAITEKLPLDNLFKIASEAGEKGLKATVKEFLKQGAIEATEEMISELSNTILDVEVMRDKSEYQSYIATLMQNGMTREDAEKEAIFQIFGMKTLKAGAAGFLSGMVMGGGATAVSKVNTAIESRNAGAAEGEAGFTKNEFSEKVSNKTIRALDAIGKKIGTNISIGAPTGTGQGSFNGYYENGRIVISQDADDPLKVVLSHEVTHRMKETAPEAYAKFLEIAVNATEQLSGKQKSEILEEYKTWYSDYTQTDFKYEDALDEITADFAGRLADDLSLFKKLVDTDRNVAQRFIDGVREFISKVKSTFSKDKSKADTASLEKYGLKVSELEEAVKQWSAMVKATETAVKSGDVQNAVAPQMQTAENIASVMSVDDIIDKEQTYKFNESEAAAGDESHEGILAEQKNTAEAEQEENSSESFKSKNARENSVTKDIENHSIRKYNFKLAETHKKEIEKNYNDDATVSLDEINSRYDKILEIWERLGGKLDSEFLRQWDAKVGKDRAFSVFKAQAGYKYNTELSSMCKKGIPLFEAIDRIVKEEVMNELKVDSIGKEEKEILYDILKQHSLEIPCAICYVEQARQGEGRIINDFLNGKVDKNKSGKITRFKLGWNDTINRIQEEMKRAGVDYTIPKVDRSIATNNYNPAELAMDEQTQEAFFAALKKIANEEIRRYNKSENKNRPLVRNVDEESIKQAFKGTLPANLAMFKTMFLEPKSRFLIDDDLLYSSMTTHNLANSHNQLYTLFNMQGGTSGYKTKQGAIVYWGDILKKNWDSDKLRKEGGVRNQSNSDFMMYTLLDQAQMYIDFTAKGYYLQAYTKVLAELKLFGLSKGKINASLIPQVKVFYNADKTIDVEKTMENAGLDENGDPIYDDIEGINHKEAFMLLEDDDYSKNAAGVCIGYSDKHISKLLDDKRIQMVIGFHDKTNDPEKRYRGARYAKNYNGENEATNKKSGKTVHIGFNDFILRAEAKFKGKDRITYKEKSYSWNDVPRLATELYLDSCERRGLNPAYSTGETDFSTHPNYYKLLADYGLYDSQGNYAPHERVEYNMPDKVPYLDENGNKAYVNAEDYIEQELKAELAVRDDIATKLADKSENGIIPQFIKRVNENATAQAENKKQYSLKGKKPIEPDAERKAERERMRELESENAKQKKLIEQLKDRMKDMSPNRIAGQVDEKAVKKAAREIVQRYSTTVKASELAPKLKKLWDRMGTGKNLSWEEVSAEAKAIATEIAKSAVEKDDTLYPEFAELRKFARETTFTISESDRSNIPDFADFRKQNMGRMNIANGKTNIDTVYKELGEMYPGLFDEEKISNPADQLLHIAEVLNDVYDITESNPFEGHMDYAVNSIANDILETFYDIPENKKTFQEMKIQRLERTVLERDAQVKETQRILNQYHKSVEKLLSDYNQKQKEVKEKKIALDEERARFYEKQDEKKKRAQIIRATNRLSQKLRWATDKKHIPQELQGAVARFLEYVNLTGLYTYDEKGKLQKSDDGSPTQKSLTYRQLRAIYQQYDGEFTFPPEFLEGVFEDGEQRGDILGQIYDLRETRVAEMNREQLDVILKGVKIVETAVKNADIMFSNSRFKEISSLAENIKEDAPIKNKFVENRFKSMLKQILDIDNLTPQAYFHRLGAGGDAIFNMLSEAEAKRTRIVQKVGEFTEKLLDPKTRRELEESTVKVELGGEDIEMSVAQIMELYALSRRKQAEKHILEGGVIIEGIPGKKGEKRREPIRASVREIGEAINNLTPEQRKLAEQLSKFASDKLGGYMNEACKKVFGYEKFGEINYWPIRIDDRTIHKKTDTADAARATPTIRNFGMAKGLTHGANNALKIGSIFDTFAEHASQSATYAAYLGAMEDMRRVINYTYGDGEGMQHVLDGVFGIHEKKVNGKVEDTHPGIDYWNKLYEDINGGMKPKDGGSPFDPFLRNAKLSSIAANSRVVIQQPTAYIRAASEIDPKYLVEGTIHAKRGWEKALKYAPIAQQKDWGRADIGTGQTMKEILFGLDGTIPKIQEASMWLAGKADAAAWGSLWSACEEEIKDKHKKIKPDSDAFYDAVTKRFTQIINKTQVVDGVLQRSQNMRKQNALVKLGTMFMSEPTKQYNMIASAVYDLANSESKEKKKTAKRKLARTATALIFSTVINAAAQSIIDAMRDDDEEKKYCEKWLSAFLGLPEEGEKGKDAAKSIIGGNLVEGLNPIGYFPFAKDLWSIAQGYDVKRTDVEGIADFVQAVVEAGKSITGEGKHSIASGVNNLIASGASLFGIPYASFKRDIGAFLQTIIQGIGNPVLDYNVAKLTKNIKNAKNADFFMDILYKAKTEDKDAFKIIYKDMVKNGFKKEDIDTDIETYTSKKFDRALSSARKAKEAENATAEDKVLYKHLNREKNMKRAERAGDEDTVLDNLDKYRANVEKYLKEYPGKDEEKAIDYAYRKANYATYGAEYAIRASGGKSVYDKALEKVNRGKTTWEEYYDEYFGKDERRYQKLRDKYDISYAEYEKIAEAMSKNSTEEEEIEALHKLGYKRSTARGIRRNFNKVK